MKSCLMLNCLEFHQIIQIRPRLCTSKYPVLAENDILGSRLIACCNLAPTLAIQIWCHNYVIGHNEYLISTLSESTFPWVYSLQFLFKSTNNSSRYERKCKWVFFLNTVYICIAHPLTSLMRYRSTTPCPKKHVTTFSTITLTISVRLQ